MTPPVPSTSMVENIRRAGTVCWAICGVAAVVVLIGFLAYVFRVIWPPLILAGAIVFLLNPVVTRLQRRHIPRARSVIDPAMLANISNRRLVQLGFRIMPSLPPSRISQLMVHAS